jgi:hypothetical protein
MGHLTRVLRPSEPTHDRPPCSFPTCPGDVVPMVQDLVRMYHVYMIYFIHMN